MNCMVMIFLVGLCGQVDYGFGLWSRVNWIECVAKRVLNQVVGKESSG